VDWRDISYLSSGTIRQRSAYSNLLRLGILESLGEYDPVLVSTVNIDIEIDSSDLDIICQANDLVAFERVVQGLFGGMSGFFITRLGKLEASVASFRFEEWEYEVFGQAIPVHQQNAFRHLEQTHRIIARGGSHWRDEIRSLKRSGMKTEPAVAHCLGLPGDPYRAVLSLEELSDEALDAMLAKGPVR